MKKKVLALLLSTALLTGVMVGCASKEEATTTPAETTTSSTTTETKTEETATAETAEVQFEMIAGHTLPDTHPYGMGLAKLNELVEEKTNGAATIDVFGNTQLGSERDLIEGLQLGTIQVTCVATANLAGFTDMFLVLDLPFLFADTTTARGVCDSEIGMEILNSVEGSGLTGLCWFENGFRQVTNNVKPIYTPEDLQGLKIRVMENQMHMDYFNSLGADATPMAMGEVFTALQQGTVDGQENPIPNIESNKFDEVQKYTSLTGHVYSPAPVFIGTTYFETMPEDIQNAILESSKEAAVYQREQIDIQEADGITVLESRGMEVNEVEKAAFQELALPIYEKYVGEEAGQVAPEIYDRVMATIDTFK